MAKELLDAHGLKLAAVVLHQEWEHEGGALKERRQNLLSCMDSVVSRAGEAGIVTCYHPNSVKNSLFRTGEDYEVLFEMLDQTDVGYIQEMAHHIAVNEGLENAYVPLSEKDIAEILMASL